MPVAVAQESASTSATSDISNPPEATPSTLLDQLEATDSASISAIIDTPVSSISADLLTPTPTLEMLTGPSGVLSPSASMKGPPHFRAMMRHAFRAGEVPSVIVDALTISSIKTTVRDSKGTVIDSTPSIETYDGGIRVSVIPKTSMKPGKYTIVIEDTSTGMTITQDFLWGVLAFNTDQATYNPGDTADIALAVLDDIGMMVCDADVTLTILSPARTTTTLSTADGTIRVTPACTLHDFTLKPDYETEFQTSDEGVYQVLLSATTKNGTNAIQDSFQVSSDMPFQVKRISATRIYPPKPYPMTIDITANEDFSGIVTETVPEDFTIMPLAGVQPYADMGAAAPVTEPQTPILLSMPFEGNYPVTLGFGDRIKDPQVKQLYEQNGLKGHDGADFAMPIGTQVLAVDAGTVSRIADNPYGTTVVIDHPWGRSYYGHLSVVQVKVGDMVKKDAPIALSGNTGLTTGAHLHFGMKLTTNDVNNGYYGKIDPMPYLTSSVTYQSESKGKQISWNVDIKSGEKIQLGYTFKAPEVSPRFYLIGPLTFRASNPAEPAPAVPADNPFVLGIASASAAPSEASGSATATPSAVLAATAAAPTNSIVYQEPRRWQIAADAVGFIGSVSNVGNTSGGDVTLTLSGLGLQEDDLVIAAYSIADADNVDMAMAEVGGIGGWTEVADLFSDDTYDANLGVYYKVMGASPDASVIFDGVGGTDTQTGAVAMAFRGVDPTTPMDVAATTVSGASGLNTMHPNPPSINHNNPSGVWTVIAGSNVNGTQGARTFTFPTGYTTNAVQRSSNDTSDGIVGLGYRTNPSDPEDPGQMTASGTDGTGYAFAAVTMALRPAPEVPGIDGSLGKTSDGWAGAVPVYGTLTGGLSQGDYPYARAEVTTAASQTFYTDMTWDSGDSRFEGTIYPGSNYCMGCDDPTYGTFSVTVELDDNAGFSSIDYSSDAATFSTVRTYKRSSMDNVTNTNYTDFNPVWSTDHWNMSISDFGFAMQSGTGTNFAVAVPIHPDTSSPSNFTVAYNGSSVSAGSAESTSNAWWYNSTSHTLYLQFASLTTTLVDVDITFDTDTDLFATRFNWTYTADMGSRRYANGIIIANQYLTAPIYGLPQADCANDNECEAAGMQAETRAHEAGGPDESTDCMERPAVHVDDTPVADNRTLGYRYDIKWKPTEWADWITEQDNNHFVIVENSDDTATTGWGQQLDNGIAALRTQTYYAGERYIKNVYAFTNNDSSSHKYPMVWEREQWHATDRQANDHGRFQGDTSDVVMEQRVSMSGYTCPWQTAYDSGTYINMGLVYDKNNLPDYGIFAVEPFLAPDTAEWPIGITSSHGTQTTDQTGFEKTWSSVAPDETVSFTFWHVHNAESSWANIESAMDADCAELNTSAPSGPTTDQQMRHGKWFDSGVEQGFTF